MRYQPINPQLFIRNRQRLAMALPKDSYVVLSAGKLISRSRDTEYPFRVNSNFFWASGIEEPESVLILTSGGEQVLFVPVTTEFERLWSGVRLDIELAKQRSGVSDVRPFDPSTSSGQAKLRDYKRKLPVKPVEATELIRPLRMIKDPIEIDLMKRAAAITAQGFVSAREAIKPGVMEYQLEAELSREFLAAGANCHAYDPIVASGERACTLHYIDNDQALAASDLVLIDAGAEYANYASDVTRTWPVSGKFTSRQKSVYEAVLRVQKAAIRRLVPGVSIRDNELETGRHMTNALQDLGLLKVNNETIATIKNPQKLNANNSDRIFEKDQAYRQYFPHATSHFLGLDVHDVGDYSRPLEPGMVLTVEPGIYIREEGIGIRLEDDIMITETGNENLTQAIPIEPDEIELRLKT